MVVGCYNGNSWRIHVHVLTPPSHAATKGAARQILGAADGRGISSSSSDDWGRRGLVPKITGVARPPGATATSRPYIDGVANNEGWASPWTDRCLLRLGPIELCAWVDPAGTRAMDLRWRFSPPVVCHARHLAAARGGSGGVDDGR